MFGALRSPEGILVQLDPCSRVFFTILTFNFWDLYVKLITQFERNALSPRFFLLFVFFKGEQKVKKRSKNPGTLITPAATQNLDAVMISEKLVTIGLRVIFVFLKYKFFVNKFWQKDEALEIFRQRLFNFLVERIDFN